MLARIKKNPPILKIALAAALIPGTFSSLARAEGPNLGDHRIDQARIIDGSLSRRQLRAEGLRIFTTPFNRLDGYGDGPMNPEDTLSAGGRPTLGGNGTYLRVNGLDAQTCLECHTQISAATIPPKLGIGGVGGSAANAIILPTQIDTADLQDGDGEAGFNGRFANPPFLFGASGVEMLALEMTEDLLALRDHAISQPGVRVALQSKGVGFGSIVADADGAIDTSQLQGVDDDLIVRPFGRKGEFATTRDFDIEAMQFHFGMQPVEVVGQGVDGDRDGVVNEITVGELSALQIFATTAPRPFQLELSPAGERGSASFVDLGCENCHRSSLDTRGTSLPLRFPAQADQPRLNIYRQIKLTRGAPGFAPNGSGGVTVPLFADLKRHDMGEGLAEDFGLVTSERNREFTTARLWGIADTAPYLHDGRATTLTDAILMHGGEAQTARDRFAALSEEARSDVIEFLKSLKVPDGKFSRLVKSEPKPGKKRRGKREGN